jgi:hypothetical protein
MGDFGPQIPPVSTPDMAQSKQLEDVGTRQSSIWAYIWATLAANTSTILKAFITWLAGAFDELMSLIVPFLTASQGETTQGFYDLIAALLNDLLGVEVAGSDLSDAQDNRGRIGAMQQVGSDLFTALANEFLGNQPDSGEGEGPGGLPGDAGTPMTPAQGVAAAKAFIGFALSFSVRQGNVSVLTDALSVHLLGQIREYGEMMAENLGLGRLTRRALQPFIQTMISTPLQQALNQQYRPHVMDAKQVAMAYIRGEIDQGDYHDALALQGFKEDDITLMIEDTYTRMPLHHILKLNENNAISDTDAQARIQALGYSVADIPLLRIAINYEEIAALDRQELSHAMTDLYNGVITLDTFTSLVNSSSLGPVVKQAYLRNGANRVKSAHKALGLAFYKKAFLDGQVTIDEVLTELTKLGYGPDDQALYEVELLAELAAKKAKAAAAAAKAAAKTSSTTGTTGTSTT